MSSLDWTAEANPSGRLFLPAAGLLSTSLSLVEGALFHFPVFLFLWIAMMMMSGVLQNILGPR
jgi:hypothetical protein